MKPEPIPCSAGCKRSALEPEAAGWERLPITGWWRCGVCTRELTTASSLVGMNPEPFVDALPPHSRGALPRETASSIAAVAVKG